MALGATSCSDWLTLYPQDRIVEENFWEDKNDLDGVRYAIYQQMESTLNKFIIWGDLRSDNYEINPEKDNYMGSYDTYKKIMDAQPDSAMSEYDWGSVYTTINYCNKVLFHGPEVLEKDPQFSPTEWQQMEAEVKGLRALNYFYLLRAFKDIPYSTKVINADDEVMNFPVTNQLAVLDTIIMDVVPVADHARNRYTQSGDTYYLMTKSAIYALLADMYLWRSALRQGRGFAKNFIDSDLDSVIFYGQRSIDALAERNQASTSEFGSSRSLTDDFDSGILHAELISNDGMREAYEGQASPIVTSYTLIFNNQNSIESIFELPFLNKDNRNSDFIGGFFGNSHNHLIVNQNIISAMYSNYNDKEGKKDSRMWYSAQGNISNLSSSRNSAVKPRILKYNNCSFKMQDETTVSADISSISYKNWIIYRLTDVMLMMAEANVYRASTPSNDDANFKSAKAIVDAIHKRSVVDEEVSPEIETKKDIVNANGTTKKVDKTLEDLQDDYAKLVYSERQMELFGEGRRWFDLVRYAERNASCDVEESEYSGNDSIMANENYGSLLPDPREPQYNDGSRGVGKMMANFLSKAYPKDASSIRQRIKNRYGLYSPIYYMERRANHYLIDQNPVWDREKN